MQKIITYFTPALFAYFWKVYIIILLFRYGHHMSKNRLQTIKQLPDETHCDQRRDLVSIFNGTFDAKQLKLATMHEDSILWWHYHPYKEWFSIIGWNAQFNFYDIDNPHDWVESIMLHPGEKIIIPENVAHEAFVSKWATLIWFTEETYISPEKNDIRFSFENIIKRSSKDIHTIFSTLKK